MTYLHKLAFRPYPVSSFIKNHLFFYYNILIHVFALSSVRNSNTFSFDILTNLQESFVSMFYKKEGLKTKV